MAFSSAEGIRSPEQAPGSVSLAAPQLGGLGWNGVRSPADVTAVADPEAPMTQTQQMMRDTRVSFTARGCTAQVRADATWRNTQGNPDKTEHIFTEFFIESPHRAFIMDIPARDRGARIENNWMPRTWRSRT